MEHRVAERKEPDDMKKVIFIIIYSILVLACAVLVFNYGYNAFVLMCYKNHDYSVSAQPLQMFNWTEPYVAYYNEGNLYYQQDDYVNAVEAYSKALEMNPPEEKECSIRINMALAMVASLGDLYKDPLYAESCLSVLKDARATLLDGGCATEDGTGHNTTAEKLKEEIDAMIRELEQMQPEESDESEGEESETDKKENSTEQSTEEKDAFEEDVKKAMKERQSKAQKERQEGLEDAEIFDGEYNFDLDGKIW